MDEDELLAVASKRRQTSPVRVTAHSSASSATSSIPSKSDTSWAEITEMKSGDKMKLLQGLLSDLAPDKIKGLMSNLMGLAEDEL